MQAHGFLAARLLAVFLGVAILAPSVSAGERSDTITRSVPVEPGGRLLLVTDRGSIEIEGGEGSQVEVAVHRRVVGGSGRRAAELLAAHEVSVTGDGREVRVEAGLQDPTFRWSWRRPRLEMEIRVRVPRRFHVEARTPGGSIRVHEIEGDVAVHTAGGSLGFENIHGNLTGRTAGGSIHAEELDGTVELRTSGGSIRVEKARGERLLVSTSGGSIRLADVDMPVEAKTSGGSIRIDTRSSGPLHATTSGGSVEVTFAQSPAGDVHLRSSGGRIEIEMPPAAAFELDARSQGGSVTSEFPVATTASGKRGLLRGTVNGGGPKVTLHTAAGGVRIRKS